MDIVYIKGLTLQTVIGCHEWEKLHEQRIVLDIEMAWDNRLAAQSDALGDALDYEQVCRSVEAYVAAQKVELVEALAEGIAAHIMTVFAVPGLKLRLGKPEALSNTDDVGVVIYRGQRTRD